METAAGIFPHLYNLFAEKSDHGGGGELETHFSFQSLPLTLLCGITQLS